jgi:hypothetical protein
LDARQIEIQQWRIAMKTHSFKILIIAYALLVQTPMVIADAPSGLNSDVIGKAMDTPATVKPDGVVRVGWQRDDVPPSRQCRTAA